MKSNLRRLIAFVLAFVMLVSMATTAGAASSDSGTPQQTSSSQLTRKDLQDALVSTMWSYYWKGTQAQYESYLFTSVDYPFGGVFRNTSEVAPEYGTSDTTIYSVCSSYPYMAYYNSFTEAGAPFKWIKSNTPHTTDYITYTMWERADNKATVLRWAQNLTASDQSYMEKYGWGTEESFTKYKDWDAKQLAEWFAANWETFLQPGDMIVVFTPTGHTVTYIGGGLLLESSGGKWGPLTGETYEGDGTFNLYTVEDYFVNGSARSSSGNWFKIDRNTGTAANPVYPLTYFMIMRPLNLLLNEDGTVRSDVEITPATQTRQEYPGLEIDRTVDISPYGTVEEGGQLTYSIKLINNSNNSFQGTSGDRGDHYQDATYQKWHEKYYGLGQAYTGEAYTGLTVTETIPAGTELVAGSITGGGSESGGTITWTVDLAAGAETTLTYQVKATATRGDLITNDGGLVGTIPSNTITNVVGGKKLSGEVKENIRTGAENIIGYHSEYESFLAKTDTDFAKEFYDQVMGLRLELPSANDLFHALFRKAVSGDDVAPRVITAGLYIESDPISPAYQLYRDMLVRHYIGGEFVHTNHETLSRILEFRKEYLEAGDILIKGDLDENGQATNTQCIVYLGENKDGAGQFAWYNGRRVEISSNDFRMWDSYAYDFFFTLRPSQAYDDINTSLEGGTVYQAKKEGEPETLESLEDRQTALLETAYAYINKGELIQYDSEQLTNASKESQAGRITGPYRETDNVTPEDITTDAHYYGVIGAVIWEVYHSALGIGIDLRPGSLISSGRNKYLNWAVYNSENESDTLHVTDLDRFIAEVLQPGDVLFYTTSSNSLALYLEDGKFLSTSGSKYNVTTGAEVVEPNGMLLVRDFKEVVGNNLKSIVVIRPAANLDYTYDHLLTDASKGRIQFHGLVIDRTVDVTPYGTVSKDGELTYTITVANKGKQDHDAIEIVEAVPEGTQYVSNVGGGVHSGGKVTWTVALKAGAEVTVQYTVKVTGSYSQGETAYVVSGEGSSVAGIPANILKTAIGGEPLRQEAQERFAGFESGTLDLSGLSALNIIQRVYYYAVTGRTDSLMPVTQAPETILPLLMAKRATTQSGTVYSFPTHEEWAAAGLEEFGKQIVDRFIGGYRLYTVQEDNARILEFELDNFQTGDIFIKLQGNDAHYYLYLGAGRFLHTYTGDDTCEILTWDNSNPYNNFIWDSLAKKYEFFLLQRPYQGSEDINDVQIVEVQAVKLDRTTLELEVGEYAKLTATVEPANATNQELVWTSADETIATVDGSGKVIAVEAGQVKITVSVGGKSAECEVTVVPATVLGTRTRALKETAYAYYNKGEQMQFDKSDSGFLTADGGAKGSNNPIRETDVMSPEDVTSQSSYFGKIGSLIWEIYYNALGIEISEYPADIDENSREDFRQYYVYNADRALDGTDELPNTAEKLEKFISEVLLPGDIVFWSGSSNSVRVPMLYLGDGNTFTFSGSSYLALEGKGEQHEQNALTVVTAASKIGNPGTLTSIVVARPAAFMAEKADITASAEGRLQYPGMVIDRTVNISPYGTTYTGDTLTYTIAITNKSESAYEALPVEEIIPANTAYSAHTGNGSYDAVANRIIWSLDVPAGMTVTVTYSVTVTGEWKLPNDHVVADGGKVAGIPSNTLSNAIGGAPLSDEVLARFAQLRSITNQATPGVIDTELGLAGLGSLEIIQRVYSWALTGVTNETVSSVADDILSKDDIRSVMTAGGKMGLGKTYVFPSKEQAVGAVTGSGNFYEQIVDGFVGGYWLYTPQKDNARIQEFSNDYFQVGDILVRSVSNGHVQYCICLGDGRFFYVYTSNGVGKYSVQVWNEDDYQAANHMWNLLANKYYFFLLLRPSQSYEDINNVDCAVLTVSNTIDGTHPDPDKTFAFTVTLDDTSVNGAYGDMTFENGVASFELTGGAGATASGLPAGITYQVTQRENDGYTVISTGVSGTINAGEKAVAAFTNTRGSGSLTITNTVTGNRADPNKSFTFTVTLDEAITDSFGDVAFTDGAAVIQLKGGESKTITGLPAAIGYTVAESDSEDYTVTSTGESGTITADGDVQAVFTNNREGSNTTTPPTRYSVSVRATENGTVTVSPTSAAAGVRVTLTVTPAEGYALASLTVSCGNGTDVDVRDNDDGTYSFTMPAGDVIVSAVFQAVLTADSFTDIREGAWYYPAVDYVARHGIMVGMDAGKFGPRETVTRAMVMTMLARMDGVNTEGGRFWYTNGLAWAVESGISDGTNPKKNITREQVVTMLWRYIGKPTVSGEKMTAFPDTDSVSSWAQDAMAWAVEAGIIVGSDGMLIPKSNATRAQMAAIMMRFCMYLDQQ